MQCAFSKNDGTRCNAKAMGQDKHCFFHSADAQAERREAQSQGGKANVAIVKDPLPPIMIKGVDDVVLLLGETINQVRAGELDVRVANCIGVLSGHLIKALEVSTVANRVEIIERAILEKRTRI